MSLRVSTFVGALEAPSGLSSRLSPLLDAPGGSWSELQPTRPVVDTASSSAGRLSAAQINSLAQAVSDARAATSIAQAADDTLATVHQILQRERDLAVQAASGSDDGAAQAQLVSLNSQLDDIARATAVGGTFPLSRNFQGVYRLGAGGAAAADGGEITLALNAADSGSLGVSAIDLSTRAGAQSAVPTIDAAISAVSASRSQLGATRSRLGSVMGNLQTTIQNVTAASSDITDADLASEVSAMSQTQILTSGATSVLAQANSAPQAILKLLQ